MLFAGVALGVVIEQGLELPVRNLTDLFVVKCRTVLKAGSHHLNGAFGVRSALVPFKFPGIKLLVQLGERLPWIWGRNTFNLIVVR